MRRQRLLTATLVYIASPMSLELLALGYLAAKVRERLEDKFESGVVRRWQNHRARRFLATFS
jgi:hypothetical protein